MEVYVTATSEACVTYIVEVYVTATSETRVKKKEERKTNEAYTNIPSTSPNTKTSGLIFKNE